MKIQLSDHFTVPKLLRFTLPSIAMMIFTSIYYLVDGFFVSNFVGKTPFAAVNFIMPFLMILGTLGFMFGTGGCALVAKTLGEGRKEKANSIFSLVVYVSAAFGVLLAVFGIIFIPHVAHMLGAEGEMLKDCVLYGRIILITLPFYMLQIEFQSFFITAEKPTLGLLSTVGAGMTNIILDAILVIPMGLVGAALATTLSQFVGGVIPLFYFFSKNKSLLRLRKAKLDIKALFKVCTNGSSELMTNISLSVVSMLYNYQLLRFAGENGIAAYGTMMYVNMIFIGTFIGYSIGSAPIISFHYGAENTLELKGLLKKSVGIISVSSIIMVIMGILLATPLSKLYVGYDKALFELTVKGFYIYSLSFLFSGFAIFSSGFFTALNNGLVSALISFMRTFVFQVAAVLILPEFFGVEGIWMSIVAAEILAVAVSWLFIIGNRKKYKY